MGTFIISEQKIGLTTVNPNGGQMETQLTKLMTGLNQEKSSVLLAKFSDFETIAEKWKAEAVQIVVTDESQTKEMERAREGRLILKDKRTSIERTRKMLKEESLRTGQAIDKIAKYLTSLIEPIEEYLEKQEKFVEFKRAAELKEKLEKERIEREAAEAKAKAEKDAAEAAERERIRKENEALRAEQEKLRKEKAEADRKAAEEKRAADEKLRQERMKTEVAERARLKAEDDARMARERVRIVQTSKNEQISSLRKENIELKKSITCPNCGHKFNQE